VLVARRRASSGAWEPERVVIDEVDRYAIHPSMAAGPDGTLWLAYDSVSIPHHGGSGDTAYRPVEQVGIERLIPRNQYLPDR
jgi:hypothetical protein